MAFIYELPFKLIFNIITAIFSLRTHSLQMQKQYEDRDVAVVLANVSITASKIRDNC
jgi:hypothetical protein